MHAFYRDYTLTKLLNTEVTIFHIQLFIFFIDIYLGVKIIPLKSCKMRLWVIKIQLMLKWKTSDHSEYFPLYQHFTLNISASFKVY